MGEVRKKANKKEDDELLEQLEVVGDSPRYLCKLFLLCMIPSILNGLNVTSYVYLTDVPVHWCRIPALQNTTWNTSQILQLSNPAGSNSSSCSYYDLNYTLLAEKSFEEAMELSSNINKTTVDCHDRIYDTSVPSMVLDFDLTCERAVYKPTIQVAISLGKFLGAFLFGIVSDKCGRRVSFLCGSLLYMLSGPLIALANSYFMVIIGRIGLGAAGSGIYHSAYVILSEIASKRRRASLGIIYNMSYPIGQMIVPIVAYFVRDWRILQYILSAPAIFILLFWWFLPESPMWLLSKGRRPQATRYIRAQYSKIRGTNEIPMKSDVLKPVVAKETTSKSTNPPKDWKTTMKNWSQIYKLLRHGELRCRMAIALFTWCVCSFSYYGLALNVDNFGTDRYVYGFLTGLVEVPSYVLPLPLLKVMGRRHTTILLFYIGGIALLLILLLPESDGINIPLLAVASIGRLCVSGVFAVVILHTTELFPTLLRNTAIGVGSTASHIGSMSAPLFVDLAGTYSRYIPSTAFGLLTLLAGTFTLLLPETRNKQLPNTVEDVIKGPKESKVGCHQICRLCLIEKQGITVTNN